MDKIITFEEAMENLTPIAKLCNEIYKGACIKECSQCSRFNKIWGIYLDKKRYKANGNNTRRNKGGGV